MAVNKHSNGFVDQYSPRKAPPSHTTTVEMTSAIIAVKCIRTDSEIKQRKVLKTTLYTDALSNTNEQLKSA